MGICSEQGAARSQAQTGLGMRLQQPRRCAMCDQALQSHDCPVAFLAVAPWDGSAQLCWTEEGQGFPGRHTWLGPPGAHVTGGAEAGLAACLQECFHLNHKRLQGKCSNHG